MLSFDSSGDFVSCVVLLAMYMCYMVFSRFVLVKSSVRFPLPERCFFVVVDCFVTSLCSEHCGVF